MTYRMRRRKQARAGNILVLTAVLLTGLLSVVAFAIDLGYLNLARVELQRTADSAAMAATWELIDSSATSQVDLSAEIYNARGAATTYAARNKVCASAPIVDANYANETAGDVVIGTLADPFDADCPMTYADMNQANAVQVRVRKTTASNGEVPLFFARVMGLNAMTTEATATAAVIKSFGGFRAPANGGNLDMLPFALDKQTWDSMLAGGGTDNWSWDADDGQVSSGSDGVREVNLYPQGTGSPGNRGTVDIGGSNNSTADIARQIVEGISPEDLEHLGGTIELDDQGKLYLNGDTGISAGVKDELASIIGQPRIIPIFNQVQGPGNNAQYTIVQFAGVRILEVKLTGSNSSKRVIIQPARIFVYGGIPSTGAATSQFVYSPVWLVR